MDKLIAFTKEKGVRFIVDESFVDFANEETTLIEQSTLNANPHLFVMKSISKSYGVPGLRLGVLASGDTSRIAQIKKDVAIWNINSFGEYYMQIAEKYKKHYVRSLTAVKAERERYIEKLSKIQHLRVIPSQANYVMVEVQGKYTAKELVNINLACPAMRNIL